METLCIENRDEYIYRMTYEVNMDHYAHFTEDLKVLGSNAEGDDPPSYRYVRVGLRISSHHRADREPIPALFVMVSNTPGGGLENTYHTVGTLQRLPY